MNIITELIMTTREYIGNEAFAALITALFGIPMLPTRAFLKKYHSVRERQFPTVSDEKRCKVLNEIGERKYDNKNPQSKNIIKVLYESIGMYFPQEINEYVLDYLREKCIRFDHPDTPGFLRSTDFILVDNIDIKWSEEKFQKNKKDAWLVTLFAVAVLCTLTIMYLHGSLISTGWMAYLFLSYAIVTILLVPLFLLLLQKDLNRCKAARRFYDKFVPWLKQKRTEAEQCKVAECPALATPETTPLVPKNKQCKGLSVFSRWLTRPRWKR